MYFSKQRLIDPANGHIPESVVDLVENFKFEKFGYSIDTILNTDLDLDSKIVIGMYLIVAMANDYDDIITPYINTILDNNLDIEIIGILDMLCRMKCDESVLADVVDVRTDDVSTAFQKALELMHSYLETLGTVCIDTEYSSENSTDEESSYNNELLNMYFNGKFIIDQINLPSFALILGLLQFIAMQGVKTSHLPYIDIAKYSNDIIENIIMPKINCIPQESDFDPDEKLEVRSKTNFAKSGKREFLFMYEYENSNLYQVTSCTSIPYPILIDIR